MRAFLRAFLRLGVLGRFHVMKKHKNDKGVVIMVSENLQIGCVGEQRKIHKRIGKENVWSRNVGEVACVGDVNVRNLEAPLHDRKSSPIREMRKKTLEKVEVSHKSSPFFNRKCYHTIGKHGMIQTERLTLVPIITNYVEEDGNWNNHFLILLENEAIGRIGFPVISMEQFRYKLYFQLEEPYRGYGFAYEASKGLLSYLFEEFASATILTTCIMMNHAGTRVLKRLGFSLRSVQEYACDVGYFTLDYKNQKK